MEGTLGALRGFVSCLDGAVEKGIIYGMGAWEKGEITEKQAMTNAYKMGQSV